MTASPTDAGMPGDPRDVMQAEATAAANDFFVRSASNSVGLPSEEEIRRIVDDALNSAIPEPWEVSAHATKRILDLIRPAFEAKEREIATFDAREEECLESMKLALESEEDAHRKLEAAEAKLAQAVEALEPFADEKNGVMQDLLWGDEPDTAIATITTRLGNIRAARAVVRSASAAARGETPALASGKERP